MDCVFHLTSHGWREDPCAEGARLETWRVETEHHGSSRITRWACIWRAVSLDTGARRLLHRRFGSPPVVLVPETDTENIAADTFGCDCFLTDTDGREPAEETAAGQGLLAGQGRLFFGRTSSHS